MCGRFTQKSPLERYADMFGASAGFVTRPRYNIVPSQQIIVCRRSHIGWRELALYCWGLIPHWAKEPRTGYSMINARAETVATKPAYREAFKKRRCLIPTDGFYEWKPGKPRKQPYFIHRKDGEPFALAGLWEHWELEDLKIDSCTIIVTQANELIAPIHDRMPVIVARDDYERWLDPTASPELLQGMLTAYPEAELEAYPVSLAVNKSSNDGPELIEQFAQ